MPDPPLFSLQSFRLPSMAFGLAMKRHCVRHVLSWPSVRHTSTSPAIKLINELPTMPSSLMSSLQKLNIQPRHYAKVHIQNKAYVVTKGDVIHLPVRLSQTKIGDILSLTTLSALGSRDYTLRSPIPNAKNQVRTFLDPKLFNCRATVIEHTKVPMQTTIKKKRRNRHAKAIKTKQPYTVLRVTELEALGAGL